MRRADVARDERRFAEAATLYGEAVRIAPGLRQLHLRHGEMLQEANQMEAAERAYGSALEVAPRDPKLALQLGHFYRAAGRPAEASASYARALQLKPGWAEPRREIEALDRILASRASVDPKASLDENHEAGSGMFDLPEGLRPSDVARLVPTLAPRSPDALLHEHGIGLEVRRLGRPAHGPWGNASTLSGVEAIRGFCISPHPIVDLQILLDGIAIYRGLPRGGYELAHERDKRRVLKYVFNIWLDFSGYAAGRYDAEVRCIDSEGHVHHVRQLVVIATFSHQEDGGSDAEVPVSDPDPRTLAARIRGLPSAVRPAARTTLPSPPRTVLVMRTDQLGDVVSSAAAIRRLREILPGARLIGLFTAANADIARTTGLLDEVLVADFPDDKGERRRVMPLDQQEELRRRLEPYRFDMAIDLSQSDVSRPLLLLSGAPFLYGVGGGDWPWLTAEFGLNTHDRRNRLDWVPHSAKTLALIETLGAVLRDSFETHRRDDLDRARLRRFGIGEGDRYVLLHTGARIEFSRWPHFPELAAELLDRTGVKVVMMVDDHAARAGLPERLLDHPRFILIDHRLDFDDFDAFVSFATVLVGNDSGPKHLASFRGVPAVTLFTARINWQEWGQERGGVIISRRVPCAGCALFHDPEECGQDFTCIRDIKVAEVFDAVLANGGIAASAV
ncbi:glycosyltransferase family 9 protein [Sphingomonas sp.]|uniref:glycosyltransferase family 9 protein n=1 Tax=Sphingomonas sp. TaxID=28214 RepID=UPI003AFFC047